MKLIIDINDNEYIGIKKYPDNVTSYPVTIHLYDAVKNGIPLPKGHGRLIDADAFIETMKDASKRQKYKEVLIDDCLTVDDVFKAIIESLQNEGLANGDAPTIIEADKEESEE